MEHTAALFQIERLLYDLCFFLRDLQLAGESVDGTFWIINCGSG